MSPLQHTLFTPVDVDKTRPMKATLCFADAIPPPIPVDYPLALFETSRFSHVETFSLSPAIDAYFSFEETEYIHAKTHPLWKLCLEHCSLENSKECRLHFARIEKLSEKEQSIELYFLLYYLTREEMPKASTSLLAQCCGEITHTLRMLKEQRKSGELSFQEHYCMRFLVSVLILRSGHFLVEGIEAARALLPIFCNPEFSTVALGICPVKCAYLSAVLTEIESHFSRYAQEFAPILQGHFAVHPSLRHVILLDCGLPFTAELTPRRIARVCLAALLQPIRQTYEGNCFLIGPLNTLSSFHRLKSILGLLSTGRVTCAREAQPWLAPLLHPYLFDPKVIQLSLPFTKLQQHFATARIVKFIPPIPSLTEEKQKIYCYFPEAYQDEVRQLLSAYFCSAVLQMLVVSNLVKYLNAAFPESPRNQMWYKLQRGLNKIFYPVKSISSLFMKYCVLYPTSTRINREYRKPKEFVKFAIVSNNSHSDIYCETFGMLLNFLRVSNAVHVHRLHARLFFNAMPMRAPYFVTNRTPLSFLHMQGGYTDKAIDLIRSTSMGAETHTSQCVNVDDYTPRAILECVHEYSCDPSTKGIIARNNGHAFSVLFPYKTYSKESFSVFIDSLPQALVPATEFLTSLTVETLDKVAQRLNIILPVEEMAHLFIFPKPYHPFYIASALCFWCQAHSIPVLQETCYHALCAVLDLSPVILCGDLNWREEHKGISFAVQYVFYYHPDLGDYVFGALSPDDLVIEKSINELYVMR